jgi:hypothetical protein
MNPAHSNEKKNFLQQYFNTNESEACLQIIKCDQSRSLENTLVDNA